MNKFVAIAASALILAACTDQRDADTTDTGGGGGGGETPVVPDGGVTSDNIIVGDVRSAAFNPTDGSLVVQITLDGDEVTQNYGTAMTDGDYNRYEQQLTTTDRFFTAFAGESTDGSVSAVVVSDGGQFNRFFGGATANQNSYSAPASGIINYSGQYRGLLNFGPAAGDAPGESSTPNQSNQVHGEVYLKADFSDNAVNGNIFNRTFGPSGTGTDLIEVVLVVDDIAADGSFSGSVELFDEALTGAGTYAGAFGGDDASAVAGTIALGAGFLLAPDETDLGIGTGNEREFGIFVLDSE